MNESPAPVVAVRRPRALRLIALACGAVATIALAQPAPAPTTAPAPEPATTAAAAETAPPRWGGRQMPPRWGSRPLRLRDLSGMAFDPMMDPPNVQPPLDEEWQQITEFAQENFPNRWGRFLDAQKDRPDSEIVERLRNRIISRYRLLKRLEEQVPDVYAAAVNQAKLEDDAWGASVTARRNPKDQKAQAALREKVAALVKDVLNERQKRIDEVQRQIKAQQEELDSNKQEIESLIDLQVNRLTGDDPSGRAQRDGRFGPP